MSAPDPRERMHALSEQVEAHYSVTAYTIVFGALVCLTILSFLLSYASLGWFETVVALAIAAAKVLLVVIYFMHLSKEPVSHRLAALAAALFVAILATLAAADVWTRYS